ncbi:ribonuclease HII [Candidatus Woesearchaeota archaeon CG_4_10_14_0_8_um_filter_47_5]|nr:MAG: ribonuclease HII [Candidatus Woesearchaeota archaeon CG_4_10_14_0_8_um_filter_47_5]
MVRILGIDEAGRGPVIGPLVIAAVLIDDTKEKELRKLGVADSKTLSPRKRESLFSQIIALAGSTGGYKIKIISPEEIDAALQDPDDNLNLLEARASAELINALTDALAPAAVFLDCPSTTPSAYTTYLAPLLTSPPAKMCAEHKADERYPVVSAASILAKVTRDRAIEELKKEYGGDFGSGYPSDPKTQHFLKENYASFPFFRKTWAPYLKLLKKKSQRSLGDF